MTSALETPQILETAPEKSVFEKYLLQFQYDPKTELAFIYQEGETELFQSVLPIAKYALRHMRIPSPFAEDSDFIYFTVFSRKQYDYIGLMDYALHYCKIHSYLTFYREPAKNIALSLKGICAFCDATGRFLLLQVVTVFQLTGEVSCHIVHMHPISNVDRFGCMTNRRTVFDDRFPFRNVAERNLVTERNVLPQRQRLTGDGDLRSLCCFLRRHRY